VLRRLTASVTEAVLQKNWLNSIFEDIEIETLCPNLFATKLLWRLVLAPARDGEECRCQCAREQRSLYDIPMQNLTLS
jgi:hypothetical protein